MTSATVARINARQYKGLVNRELIPAYPPEEARQRAVREAEHFYKRFPPRYDYITTWLEHAGYAIEADKLRDREKYKPATIRFTQGKLAHK